MMSSEFPTSFPTLATKRLNLRAVLESDVSDYHRLLSKAEVTSYTDIPDAPTLKRTEKLLSWMSERFPSGKGCAWIIEDNKSMQLMGAIRINQIDKKTKCGVIGYELDSDFWGKGFMTEAVSAIVSCGHDSFKLNRIEAWTLPGNEASDKVLLKNGFQHEGTMRQKARFKGSYHDERIFARLAIDPQ